MAWASGWSEPVKGLRIYNHGRGALGVKYRLYADGTIADKKTGKEIGFIDDGTTDEAYRLSSATLDAYLRKYINQ